MKKLNLLVIFCLMFLGFVAVQAQYFYDARIRYGANLPTSCFASRNGSLFYKTGLNAGLYHCKNGEYELVASSGAVAGVTSINGRTGALSLILGDIPLLPATQITSGVFTTARLGTGAADNTKFLRGDGTWAVPAGSPLTLNSSNYTNLSSVVSSLAGTPAVLTLTSNLNCASTTVVPATLRIESVNNAKIIKQTGCTIEFQGQGLMDATSDTQIFSGFAPGNITFSGSVYPREISTGLFSNTDLTSAINILSSAFTNKYVTFKATPSTITGAATVNNRQNIEFQCGEFPNSASVYPQFLYYNEITFSGKGNCSNVYEPTNIVGVSESENTRMFAASGGFYGTNNNVTFKNFTIKRSNPNGVPNQSAATIYFGNCHNCLVENVTFDKVNAFGAFCGGFGDQGNRAENCNIRNNTFLGIKTQNTGVLNCINCHITGNNFILSSEPSVYIAVIDIEPNVNGDDVVNLIVANNIIDGRLRNDFYTAITVNGTAADTKFQNIQVVGNLLSGQDDGASGVKYMTEGIGFRGVSNGLLANNQIAGCGQVGIYAIDSYNLQILNNHSFNCGGDSSNFIFRDLLDSTIKDNFLRLPLGFPQLEYNGNKITEEIVTKQVNVSGTAVTKTDGSKWDYWLVGRAVKINGTNYTVVSLNTNNTVMVIDTNLGTLSNVPYLSNSSNNIYKDNRGAWYSFATNSTSRNLTANGLSTDVTSASQCIGTATLESGSVVVNSNCIRANSVILISKKILNGVSGTLQIVSQSAGTFTIGSTTAENSTVNYQIIN